MLRDRLITAARLYERGCAPKILVSGDHASPDYDEVSIMARVLEEAGVPAEDIFLDHSGFRTLDSMYRARKVYGLERILVVSNPFHVARAVFLGESFGISTLGVGAEELQPYSFDTHASNQAREIAARILAWLDVYLWDTRPRKMDEPVSMEGDGRRTR
jgi:vancomycin permeability regulator SanA